MYSCMIQVGGIFNAPANDVDFTPEEYATMIAVPIVGGAVIVIIIVTIVIWRRRQQKRKGNRLRAVEVVSKSENV